MPLSAMGGKRTSREAVGLGGTKKEQYDAPMGQDAQYYRQRAEESRTMAENARSSEARATLLDIAEQYERLARKAEARN